MVEITGKSEQKKNPGTTLPLLMVGREVTQTRSQNCGLRSASAAGRLTPPRKLPRGGRMSPKELKSLENPKEGLKGVPSDTVSL